MNVFELFAKLGLDTKDYEEKLNSAKEKASGIGSALGTAAKVGAAAIGAAATAIGALTTQSVNAYSEYEQLEGGIQTLYGENSKATEEMMKNASEAWKTAGLSANEYMNTAIESSAAMLNSVGGDTEKAATLMDQTIIDMSDNVNKMGTSMEAVQNAYRGFSRGNFTMLDNLALGFAGTKEGMQELLDKAEELSGVKYDVSSYADIVQAIHVVQEEMGIAGTTSREATETIQGSLSALKSAWTNLVTGFADPNADIGNLIDNMVEAGVTALDNLVPAVERALVGIGEGVQKIVPVITEQLPDLVNDLLPPLLDAAAQLVNGLVSAIPAMLGALVDIAPQIINTLIDAIINMLPQLVDAGLKLIIAIAEGIGKNLNTIVPAVVQAILTIVQTLLKNLPLLLNVVLTIIKELAKGIVKAIPVIIEALPEIIKAIIEFFMDAIPQIIEAGIELLTSLIAALPDIILAIVRALPELIAGIIEGILSHIGDFVAVGIELLVALITDIPTIILEIVKRIPEIVEGIIDGFADAFANGDFGRAVVELANGLMKAILKSDFFSTLMKFFGVPVDAFKKAYQINSPSKVTTWLGTMLGKGYVNGIVDSGKEVVKAAQTMNDNLDDVLNQDHEIAMSYQMNNLASNRSAFVSARNGYSDDSNVYGEEIIIPRNEGDTGRDLTVILELDRVQLGRAVYRLNNEETQRVGVRLAGGLA